MSEHTQGALPDWCNTHAQTVWDCVRAAEKRAADAEAERDREWSEALFTDEALRSVGSTPKAGARLVRGIHEASAYKVASLCAEERDSFKRQAEDARRERDEARDALHGEALKHRNTEALLADAVRERDEAHLAYLAAFVDMSDAQALTQRLRKEIESIPHVTINGGEPHGDKLSAITPQPCRRCRLEAALAEAPQAAPQAGPWRCCWCHKVLPNQSVGPDYEFCPFCRGTFSFGKPTQAAPASQPADRQGRHEPWCQCYECDPVSHKLQAEPATDADSPEQQEKP